jgi:CheY-like chemotaxis protein
VAHRSLGYLEAFLQGRRSAGALTDSKWGSLGSVLSRASPTVVLVVDDEVEIREALRDVLEDAGYSVAEAAHGREALDYLAVNSTPHVILLDLFMPVMDGWELIKKLRTSPHTAAIPVIVVTASGPHWGYPTEQVIRKPFEVREVLERIARLPRASPDRRD